MIEVKNVSKYFGHVPILEEISFVCEEGKTNLIIGGSGSGKTVLMKCIVGLFEIDKGGIFYHGRSFSELNFTERKEIRKEIGMVFQGGALFDSMTVEENLAFPLTMFTDMNKSDKKDRVNFCLSRVNLENVNKKFPSELSGGMKKRVAIARAIVMNPKYLFCDEPNSGLDPQTSIVIDNLIMEITQEYGITTLINTHDMNSVLEHGDKIFFIYKGRLWWEGNKETVLSASNKELRDLVFASKVLRNFYK
jgi:phospholipid/cholesterol/gamma-HCH transport system ATP-binding protein